jgi:hypothetical protein|tara:strand:- start:283 stop:540 length:258 start_codon:yes stop_codon:yes gene_type:complete
MSDKIDTQGMSGPVIPGKYCKDNVYPKDAEGNPIYPPANFKVWTIFEEKERQELKDIINEVLDERELRKKMKGPYDVYSLDELQE